MKETKQNQLAHTTFRMLLSLIFLVAGIQHLLNPHNVAKRLSMSSWADLLTMFMPLNIHVFLAGVVLFAAGLGLFFGSKTRLSSLALIAVLIPITMTVQMDGAETLGPLFKNIAILGGLIYFAYYGIGDGFGIDALSVRGRRVSHYFSTAKVIMVGLLAVTLTPSLLSPTVAEAASAKVASKNVAILVREERHLHVAIETLIQGQKEKSNPRVVKGTVVVCGKPGVAALSKESKIKEDLVKGLAAGIRIVACGLSLKEAAMPREDLFSGIEIIENGLWEMIRLQSEGYVSIEL